LTKSGNRGTKEEDRDDRYGGEHTEMGAKRGTGDFGGRTCGDEKKEY